MTFDLNDNMIIDLDHKIAWTFKYLKENKDLSNLFKFLREEEKEIAETINSFYESKNYLMINYPELLL